MSSSVRMPPPTVSGMNTCSAVRRTTSSMMSRPSWLAVMSKKHQLVGTLALVPRGHLDRIAGVAQVDKIRALHHAAAVDVQTRNHTLGEHESQGPVAPAQAGGNKAAIDGTAVNYLV